MLSVVCFFPWKIRESSAITEARKVYKIIRLNHIPGHMPLAVHFFFFFIDSHKMSEAAPLWVVTVSKCKSGYVVKKGIALLAADAIMLSHWGQLGEAGIRIL